MTRGYLTGKRLRTPSLGHSKKAQFIVVFFSFKSIYLKLLGRVIVGLR